MKRNFFTTIVLAIALLADNSPLLAAPSLTLTMGFGDSDVPPRKWKQDGQFVGLSLDIMQEVARRCQVTVEMKPYPWKRLLHYVQNGKIDGAFGIYRTPEREQYARFVDHPISSTSYRLFVRKGDEFPFKTIEDLYGRRVGKLLGTKTNTPFDSAVEQGLIEIEATNSYPQLLKKLYIARNDLLVAPGPAMQHHLQQLGIAEDIVMLPQPLGPPSQQFIMFSKAAMTPEKEALIDKMAQALSAMTQEGVLEQIYHSYGVTLDLAEPAKVSPSGRPLAGKTAN